MNFLSSLVSASTTPAAASENASPAADSAEPSPSVAAAVPADFTLACALAELPVNDRRCMVIDKRSIVLFRQRHSRAPAQPRAVLADGSTVFAMDSICYHMGGPLAESDIEELGSTVVAVCPWHHYRISLDTGEGFYQSLDGKWKSKGVKQRVHPCIVSGGIVYVRVTSVARDGGSKIESDTYCDKEASAAEVAARESKRLARGPVSLKPSGFQFGLIRGTRY